MDKIKLLLNVHQFMDGTQLKFKIDVINQYPMTWRMRINPRFRYSGQYSSWSNCSTLKRQATGKAILLKPYAIEAKFGLIKPLSATENWDRVKTTYTDILKIDPQNTLANYWLGVIYYNRKEYASANKLFEKVANLYPLDYDATIMLAWTKLKQGKTAEAKVLFQHALTLRPNDSSSLEGLKLIK